MHGHAPGKQDMWNQSSRQVQAYTHNYSKAASACSHSPASLEHLHSRLAWPGRCLLLLLLLLELVQLRRLLCGRTQRSQLSM